MNPDFARAVDQNARNRFLEEISGYAGISAIQSLTYAPCLNKHVSDFRNGKKGPRDPVRAAVHFEASQLRNAEARVLAFHLSVEAAGFEGTCAPQDVLAAGVRDTTGGLCAPRTYREGLRGLVHKGWLSNHLIPTGTRTITREDESGPVWSSLKVNKTILTRSARMLLLRNPPTSDHKSLPRQKPPTTVGDKDRANPIGSIPYQSDLDFETSRVSQERESKESPRGGDRSTRPSSAPPSPTVKHQTSKRAPRKTASRTAVSKPSARQSRNKAVATWDASRAALLRDLFAVLKDDLQRNDLLRIAAEQTDRAYPAAWFSLTDWDRWVWKWSQFSYHDARRAIKNQILPPLRAFCADLYPPDTSRLDRPDLPDDVRQKIEEELEAHKRLSVWMRGIPAVLPNNIPKVHRDRLEAERWKINRITYAVHTGKMNISELSADDHDILSIAAMCKGVT